MKRIYFIAAALAFCATNVLAETTTKKPTSKWTCAEFLAVDDQFQPKVIYWSSAQNKKGKPAGENVDIEGTEKVIPMVIDDCKKAPQESFWGKLKDAWKKIETDAKSLGKKL
jgi:acid stress chaperone HdeA